MPAETHRSATALGRDEIAELVADVVAELVGPTSVTPRPSDRLCDIGVDDLTLLSVVDALEHELGERTVGLSIDDDELFDLETVGDVVELVCAQLGVMESGR